MLIMGRSKRLFIILVTLIIFLIIIPLASAENLFVEVESSEQNWDFLRWREIIRIDDEGNANIICSVSFLFKNSSIESEYWLSIRLDELENDPILHHPFEKNNTFSNFFNYSIEKSSKGTYININLPSNASENVRFYQFSFSYLVPNVVEKKSMDFEAPIHWELQSDLDRSSHFNPDFYIYIVLPKNARLDFANVDVNHPSEIPDNDFSDLDAYSWSPTKLLDSIDLDFEKPQVEGYSILYINNTSFPENGKLVINYNTPNIIWGIFGIVGLIAGIIGSIFGGIGGYYSYKAYKSYKSSKNLKSTIYKEVVLSQKTEIAHDIDKLDSLILITPSIFAILGFLIQLLINSIAYSLNISAMLHEIAYYSIVPLLFFVVFLPLYIGYWRGALTKHSIIERVRGWIYLIIGVTTYISSVVLFFILLISPLLIGIIFIVGVIIFILYITIFSNSIVKTLFNICGQKTRTNKDRIIIFRTYVASIAYFISFYTLVTSAIIHRFFYFDWYYAYMLFIIVGIPLTIFILNFDGKTAKYVDGSIPIEHVNENTSKKNLICMIGFLMIGIVLLILYLPSQNLTIYFLNLMMYSGFLIFLFRWGDSSFKIKYQDDKNYNNEMDIYNLTKIKGVGLGVVNKLIKAGIKSMDEIKKMDVEKLANVKGIGKKTAELILSNIENTYNPLK